jgi:hypothetical protein
MKIIGRKHNSYLNIIISVIFFVAIVFAFNVGLGRITQMSEKEQLRVAEQAIIRSTIQCYALEGEYPQSIEYLKENYGLMVDEEKFFIDYVSIASNLMPQITVLPKGDTPPHM